MAASSEIVFEDSDVKPSGRKARVVSDALWAALADSAKRDVGKVITGTENSIGELIKDLGSAAVKRRYEVTTDTANLEGGKRKLLFSAIAKPSEKSPASASK